ncbi:MAG TPA: cyclic nucleotide-binding domain-containing protein, partial [Chitinophagales bacterium]|nr:cyclic nucleotide-binding domain-containing protein [Chitinophagales bacterium]
MLSSVIQDKLKEFFPGFEHQLISYIAQHATLKTVPAGQELMQPGQYFRSVILVTSGKVKVYRPDEEGNEYFMYYLEPGSACALSMVCAARSLVSEVAAKTADDAELILIPIELMDELVRHYKSWYY